MFTPKGDYKNNFLNIKTIYNYIMILCKVQYPLKINKKIAVC